jgi:hypothetical protein
MRYIAPLVLLLLAACSGMPDIAACRLVGKWRPNPTRQEENDIWNSTRIACPPTTLNRPAVITLAINACTVSFASDGGWSTPSPANERALVPSRWRVIEGGGERCLIWVSESPFGPERTVSCVFASPDELIVRDPFCFFTRFVRDN